MCNVPLIVYTYKISLAKQPIQYYTVVQKKSLRIHYALVFNYSEILSDYLSFELICFRKSNFPRTNMFTTKMHSIIFFQLIIGIIFQLSYIA